ncbi:hypothetical protein Bbelb_046170 [Branchiostoma belcheri]|nr:hypothetical protein Bbelb_046170 [Branchiostoma belcheri]
MTLGGLMCSWPSRGGRLEAAHVLGERVVQLHLRGFPGGELPAERRKKGETTAVESCISTVQSAWENLEEDLYKTRASSFLRRTSSVKRTLSVVRTHRFRVQTYGTKQISAAPLCETRRAGFVQASGRPLEPGQVFLKGLGIVGSTRCGLERIVSVLIQSESREVHLSARWGFIYKEVPDIHRSDDETPTKPLVTCAVVAHLKTPNVQVRYLLSEAATQGPGRRQDSVTRPETGRGEWSVKKRGVGKTKTRVFVLTQLSLLIHRGEYIGGEAEQREKYQTYKPRVWSVCLNQPSSCILHFSRSFTFGVVRPVHVNLERTDVPCESTCRTA